MDDYHGPFDPGFDSTSLAPRPGRAGARVPDGRAPPGPRRHPAGARTLRRAGDARGRDRRMDGCEPGLHAAHPARARFSGDDVATIFKGMQFDVGAPHGFLDFRFRVDDEGSGEFWLPYCGALMDVEPMGEEFVVGMCHHIEDPTFDATAVATNPARAGAAHPSAAARSRRPRAALPLAGAHRARRRAGGGDPAHRRRSGASRLARRRASRDAAAPEPAGRADYCGPVRPGSPAGGPLARCARASSPGVLPAGPSARARLHDDDRRALGRAAAREIARQQWVGIAGVAAERLSPRMRRRRATTSTRSPSCFSSIRRSIRAPMSTFHVERLATRCAAGSAIVTRFARVTPIRGLRCSPRSRAAARVDAIVRTVNPRARWAHRNARRTPRMVRRIDPSAEPAPEPPKSRSPSSARERASGSPRDAPDRGVIPQRRPSGRHGERSSPPCHPCGGCTRRSGAPVARPGDLKVAAMSPQPRASQLA